MSQEFNVGEREQKANSVQCFQMSNRGFLKSAMMSAGSIGQQKEDIDDVQMQHREESYQSKDALK